MGLDKLAIQGSALYHTHKNNEMYVLTELYACSMCIVVYNLNVLQTIL